MKLEGSHSFSAAREQVWDFFMNPKYLQKALPGCVTITQQAPGKYDALLKIGISAVKGSYLTTFEIADTEYPERYRLIVEGSGSTGFVKGDAVIELSQQDQHTVSSYRGDVQVGGLIAGVGQRLIGGIAKMMINQFFKKMKKEFEARSGEKP
jgi:carbon monoxide dehydrogenase subunit G